MGKLLNKKSNDCKRTLLGLTVKKLKNIKEPEILLRRAVLMNNTFNWINSGDFDSQIACEINHLEVDNKTKNDVGEYDIFEDIEFPTIKNPELEKFQCLELQPFEELKAEIPTTNDHEVPELKDFKECEFHQILSKEFNSGYFFDASSRESENRELAGSSFSPPDSSLASLSPNCDFLHYFFDRLRVE